MTEYRTFGDRLIEVLERMYDREYGVFGKDERIERLLDELKEANK